MRIHLKNVLAIVFDAESGFFVEKVEVRGEEVDHLSTTPQLKLTEPLVFIRIILKQQWGLGPVPSGLQRGLLD